MRRFLNSRSVYSGYSRECQGISVHRFPANCTICAIFPRVLVKNAGVAGCSEVLFCAETFCFVLFGENAV